jgi:hypothetical protein
MALTLLCSGAGLGHAQNPAAATITYKGVLVTIKGDVYTVQDLSGRFVQFRVDKNTQRERLIVPGERVEVQLTPDHRAIAIKPVQ